MNIIILCAGVGRRFNSKLPKCLTGIYDKTIVEYTLTSLNKIKSNKKIIFATGYQEELIKKKTNYKYQYIFNKKFKSTNMVYTLFNVIEKINIDTTIIIYGDIIFSLKDLKKIYADKRKLVTLLDFNWKKLWLTNQKIKYDLESLKISKNIITELGRKTKNPDVIDARYIGITKFSKKTISKLLHLKKNNGFKDINFNQIDMTNFMMSLIKKNIKINFIKSKNRWYEFDNKKDLSIFTKKYNKSMFQKLFL